MNEIISIIIPIYNPPLDKLSKCLSSVLSQDYCNIEILLVDDGSDENTRNYIREFEQKDNRIIAIFQENSGVSAARNCGLHHASGSYILFVDSDDYVSEDICSYLYRILIDSDSDISICSCVHLGLLKNIKDYVELTKIVNNKKAIENLAYNRFVYDELETTAVWGKLYKREVIEDILFNESLIFAEDYIFNFYALENSKKIIYSNRRLYYYSFSPNGLMNNSYNPFLYTSYLEVKKLTFDTRNVEYYKELLVRCINISLSIYLKIPYISSYVNSKSDIKHFIKKYRFEVIKNSNTKKELKIALLLSCVSFRLVDFVYRIKKNLSNKKAIQD